MGRSGRGASRAVGATIVGVVAVGCGDAATTQVVCANHSRLKALKERFDIGHAGGDNA